MTTPIVPRQTPEALTQLVGALLRNEVFCGSQVRDPDLVAMVFLPLAMGALKFPEPEPALPAPPVEPTEPIPPLPLVPVAGDDALEAAVRDARTELSARVRARDAKKFEVNWGQASESELDAAEAAVRQAREALRSAEVRLEEDRVPRQKAAEHAYHAATLAHQDALERYHADLEAHALARTAYAERQRGLSQAVLDWESRAAAWRQQLLEELGEIYSYHRDALPRGINGYPMFLSMHWIHKEDWKRVVEAVRREKNRKIEI